MSLNWPALYAKGRCKDIGIPWEAHENEALEALIAHTGLERHAIAPFVREGVLTVEQYEAAKAGGDNKPSARAELEAQAKELGIEFAPETPDTVLKGQITKARKKAEADAKAAAEAAKAGGDNKDDV